MSFVYTPAKELNMKAALDYDGDDLRVMLLKTSGSTTADTDQDAATISAITTLGELVATGYARQALASEAVNRDDANNRAEFDAADVAFGAIGGAVNDTIGAILLFKFVTNDSDSIPIAYIDNAGSSFSMPTNGSTISITWNAEGIVQQT